MDPVSAIGLVANVTQSLSTVVVLVKYVNEVRSGSEDRAWLAREVASMVAIMTELRYDMDEFDLSLPRFSALRSLAAPGGLLGEFELATKQLTRKLKRTGHLSKVFRSLSWPLDRQEVGEIISSP
ncbi:hypothetical protein B0H67DRAFT_660136 [Lasiosphaeris hirsuta]|uniref:Fungal N-terminal domain-containing protein n=1 Tax=Lasiosphaeris hirsuta TaxID=260670 RepID=A0AA40E2X9_9PEZI|nr:hypothetical protein B0H67DRAFT_660136 [Lasiosphaeris hirsuta]